MLIKIILIASILSISVLMLRTSSSDTNLALRRLGITVFAILAVISVTWPSLTTWVANLVGVNRGADLLLYLLILVFLISLLTSHQRRARLSGQLTLLSRQIALQRVVLPDGKVIDGSYRG